MQAPGGRRAGSVMNIAGLFIRRPVMTTLVMAGILLFGLVAYRLLPVSDLPRRLSHHLGQREPARREPGDHGVRGRHAAREAVLDHRRPRRDDLDEQPGLDLDHAAVHARPQHRRGRAGRPGRDRARRCASCPPDMPPPSYQKVNPAGSADPLPARSRSTTLPLSAARRVRGDPPGAAASRRSTAWPRCRCSARRSTRCAIQLDPQALAARGSASTKSPTRSTAANVNLPTGISVGPDQAYTVQANGQLRTRRSSGRLIVAYRNGAPVRLEDLGRRHRRACRDKARPRAGSTAQRAIVLAIQRQPGTNTVAVADAVKTLLPSSFAQQLPAVGRARHPLRPLASRSASRSPTSSSRCCSRWPGGHGHLPVPAELSATIIPSLALPLSIVGTFAVMYLLGYSLDNLSLMALTLVRGLRGGRRHRDAREHRAPHGDGRSRRLQAALDGSREIGFTILSMTLSLVAVFIPVLFMGGLIGPAVPRVRGHDRAWRSWSRASSRSRSRPCCAAGFSGRDRRGATAASTRRPSACFSASLDTSTSGRWTWVMDHRRATMVFSLAILVGTVASSRVVPKGFMPSEDQGQLFGTTEAAEGTSFDAMVEHQKAVAAIVARRPERRVFMSSVGAGGAASAHEPGPPVHPPQAASQRAVERRRGDPGAAAQAAAGARDPGVPAEPAGDQHRRADSSKSQYQFTLQGPDIEDALRRAPAVAATSACAPSRGSGRDQRPADQEPAGERARSTATAPPRWASTSDADRERRSTTPTARARSPPSTRPTDQYWVIMELLPAVPERPVGARACYTSGSRTASWCRLARWPS